MGWGELRLFSGKTFAVVHWVMEIAFEHPTSNIFSTWSPWVVLGFQLLSTINNTSSCLAAKKNFPMRAQGDVEIPIPLLSLQLLLGLGLAIKAIRASGKMGHDTQTSGVFSRLQIPAQLKHARTVDFPDTQTTYSSTWGHPAKMILWQQSPINTI